MRFLHLSDLHIGLRLIGRDLMEDQEAVFGEIAAIAGRKKPDAVVIAGDIYDKADPAAEAVSVFDRFITKLSEAVPDAEIMMISGNHDSGSRINVFRSVLKKQRVHMVGLPPMRPEEHIEKVTLKDGYGPVNFYLLPFVRPSMARQVVGTNERGMSFGYEETLRRLLMRETIDPAERNVLVSHQFYLPAGTAAEDVERTGAETRTVGNIDAVSAELLRPFDYAALGHIHKPMKVGSEVYRYPGTPMPYSFDEAGQQKGMILVDMGEKGEVTTEVIPLPSRHGVQVIRGTLDEVLRGGTDDYVQVTLTDPVDLDAFDMQDRLRAVYPNLLEIRRVLVRGADSDTADMVEVPEMDPLGLITTFLGGNLDDGQRAVLAEVLDEARKGGAN